MCAIAIVGSVFYVLNAQHWWVAKGKVLEPQLNDVATLYSQSKLVGAILNASKPSGCSKNEESFKGGGKYFTSLFEPQTLFKIFVNSFNSSLSI
jgi:chain length determinant protein (polysaccharide antigen chain regulator)